MHPDLFRYIFVLLIVSGSLGGIAMTLLANVYRGYFDIKNPSKSRKRFPPAILGLIERLVFTILSSSGGPTTFAGAMTWIAAKQINVFNYRGDYEGTKLIQAREWHFAALVFSFVNGSIGIASGLIVFNWKAINHKFILSDYVDSMYRLYSYYPTIYFISFFSISMFLIFYMDKNLVEVTVFIRRNGFKEWLGKYFQELTEYLIGVWMNCFDKWLGRFFRDTANILSSIWWSHLDKRHLYP